MANREIIKTYELGVNQVRQGFYSDAVNTLAEYIEAESIDFGRREHARMVLGFAHAQGGNWNAAISCFKEVMINDIECLPSYTALGHAYLMNKQIDDSIEIFKVAVQKDPENAQARHGLGWSLLEEGRDIDEALYQTQEAFRIDPDSAPIRDTLGWALYKKGELEAAVEQMDEAVKIDPDHPVILEHRKIVKEAFANRTPEESCVEGIN